MRLIFLKWLYVGENERKFDVLHSAGAGAAKKSEFCLFLVCCLIFLCVFVNKRSMSVFAVTQHWVWQNKVNDVLVEQLLRLGWVKEMQTENACNGRANYVMWMTSVQDATGPLKK